MPRISMSAKLNDSSRLSIVDGEYKEIYLDVEHIVPALRRIFIRWTEIEELADDMLERGQYSRSLF